MPVSKTVPVLRTRVHSSTPARIEAILAKACDVLARDGHAAFNMRRVAADVGVRLATIQHHFPTREVLLTAAITKVMQDWGRSFKSIADRTGHDPVRRLRTLQKQNLDFLDDPITGRLLVECFALAQHEPSVQGVVQAQYGDFLRLYADLLRELRPDLGNDTLLAFATVLAAQIEGLVLLMRRDDPARPRRAALQRALTCQFDSFIDAFRGYEATRSRPPKPRP